MTSQAPDADTTARILKTGAEVLRIEADALRLMADTLGDKFVAAVDLIYQTRGRVILSGMGKSGHIARKIAATLASTGTPAYFVHPAEASHGDLGMITPDDTCLVLSNSGETAELSDIVAHTRRFSIPLIGVAGRPQSTLLKTADVALVLPDAPEACAIGMAPTTSTTATLALGDALAVAVMERRDFSKEQFRVFHPGGKLGAQLLKVAALMHGAEALPLVSEAAPMSDVILTITSKAFGVAGLVDAEGQLIGVITDGDLRRNLEGLLEKTAGEVASRHPRTVAPEMLAVEALGLMNDKKITTVFVVDADKKPVGLLHIHDCLRAGLV
ncbi:KpsF/GutQ family sugar-phosphate isomerase [Asticcacaulis tiandongensis]|uniref:KpsF/GutQ family sugar-phosphate isomerase n=1 Tax=Asticcacaulis tiandongensis TaxID=2565365 RepID=UPI00112C1104|nr:KpsF/GutQ family sugar-phosphate isomerase [Asticcacaulis tiandongensis]